MSQDDLFETSFVEPFREPDAFDTSILSTPMDSSIEHRPPSSKQRIPSFLSNRIMKDSDYQVPHRGALCRVEESLEATYVIPIAVSAPTQTHELHYTRRDFEFAQRLFAILDTESRGLVDRSTLKEFVTLRCPVLWRRDDDLRRLNMSFGGRDSIGISDSPTFDEVWKAVASCSQTTKMNSSKHSELIRCELGVEGLMVFCRFIALAQYLEAKRRFSARHLQQTMRHRNAPRGSELVVVDVPPPEPPVPLSAEQLANYEQQSKAPLPLPELDLDHSLLAAHDTARGRPANRGSEGTVKINLFGSSFSSRLLPTPSASSQSTANLEFAVTYMKRSSSEQVVVRRSMADMKWLDDTFTSHKVLGGTLCGRILPPFPSTGNRVLSSHFQNDDSMLNSSIKSTNGAIAAATASVGRFRNVVTKSLFGAHLGVMNPSGASLTGEGPSSSASTSAAMAAAAKKEKRKKQSISLAIPESYYNPNSPAGKARQLERYLNYLLEHPALSTSFPLNTILKASQSGLDAAKQSLEHCLEASNELKEQTPHIDDGKMQIPFWPSNGTGVSPNSPNFAWVRTAAQAAVALQLHGMLETTGMQSASARLQHASLPSFGASARTSGWDDDETDSEVRGAVVKGAGEDETTTGTTQEANDFEEGVQHVQSELQSDDLLAASDDDYDLLPLPVPAPERRILSAGSDLHASSNTDRETRFHYGSGEQGQFPLDVEEDARSAFLGDISVDENIDKLREVIGSVDNTLSRCLASSGRIGKARRERQALHLDLVRGLDAWEGMRGKFVSQRNLMKGVTGVEQSKEIYEESDLALIDDISWQNSLANSAVVAAEDVRSAVRVSRTAANAKAAASSASFTAQTNCETGDFATIDEARAAQTRASIAQSHAIHAAVVEHEAKTVKRRATLALAHDVKCWNVHRKREMLRACLDNARSQHEATRRAVDAWSCLRDGFIGATLIPPTQERRNSTPAETNTESRQRQIITEPDEVTATIYEEIILGSPSGPDGGPSIVAVDHRALVSPPEDPVASPVKPATSVDLMEADLMDFVDADLILPFATAAPIPEENEDVFNNQDDLTGSTSLEAKPDAKPDASSSEDILSASMQSLVDGLMNWGGGFDAEEDHFALPAGMAASIALEESGALWTSKIA